MKLQGKLVETMPRVCKAVIKVKGGNFEESQIYFDLTLFWLLHDSMCYFIVLMSTTFIQCRIAKIKKSLNE